MPLQLLVQFLFLDICSYFLRLESKIENQFISHIEQLGLLLAHYYEKLED